MLRIINIALFTISHERLLQVIKRLPVLKVYLKYPLTTYRIVYSVWDHDISATPVILSDIRTKSFTIQILEEFSHKYISSDQPE